MEKKKKSSRYHNSLLLGFKFVARITWDLKTWWDPSLWSCLLSLPSAQPFLQECQLGDAVHQDPQCWAVLISPFEGLFPPPACPQTPPPGLEGTVFSDLLLFMSFGSCPRVSSLTHLLSSPQGSWAFSSSFQLYHTLGRHSFSCTFLNCSQLWIKPLALQLKKCNTNIV